MCIRDSYDAEGRLKPAFQANMDRLREYRRDTVRQTEWAACLVYRLGAGRTFEQNCRRVDYRLDGMADPAPETTGAP